MLRQIFANIPDVTKNLLIINLLFFLATVLFQNQGIDLQEELGMHVPNSNLFEPYQIVTHFFMHADFRHILFNMVGLIFLGSFLERHWGKKRFFIFYIVTAIGASILHTGVQIWEVYNYTGHWLPYMEINLNGGSFEAFSVSGKEFFSNIGGWQNAAAIYSSPSLGASGAVYGLIMALGVLFPNTEFRLLFPPITIKAKWIAIILGGLALLQGFQNTEGDSIAHFAHLGGMLFGFIMIQIWKRDRSNFY